MHDDDDELPIAGGDRLAAILVHVGATRKGIKRLENDVQEVKRVVEDLSQRAVTTDDCNHVHDRLDREVLELRTGLSQTQSEIRRKPTGAGHPAVSLPPAPPSPPTEVVLDQHLTLREERQQEKRRRSITFWVAALSGILGLLGAGITGVVKLGRYLDRVDKAAEAAALQSEEVRKALAERVRKVYITVQPDAGPTTPAPPSAGAKKRRHLR